MLVVCTSVDKNMFVKGYSILGFLSSEKRPPYKDTITMKIWNLNFFQHVSPKQKIKTWKTALSDKFNFAVLEVITLFMLTIDISIKCKSSIINVKYLNRRKNHLQKCVSTNNVCLIHLLKFIYVLCVWPEREDSCSLYTFK